MPISLSGWPISCIARSSDRPSTNSPGSFSSPPTTNARSTPAPSSQAIRSDKWVRSRTIRADRWGTARKPWAWSCSQSATVASIPFAGDAVTDTVARGGRNVAWSSAFFSGTSSNVGEARIRVSASRAGGASVWRRRKSTAAGSDFRVRHRRLALGDELLEGLVDARVDRRGFVLGEHPLPDRVRPLCRVQATVLEPLLERVVVGGLGSVEGRLEVRQRVGRPQVVLARGIREHRVERLAVLAHVDALHEDRRHPALVVVEDELLVADGQPALEPARRVKDEVDAGEDRWTERRRALVRGLGVRDLRR